MKKREELKQINIWTSINSGGIDAPFNVFFLTEKDALTDVNNESKYECKFPQEFIEMIETFEGSNVHQEAVLNSRELERD